MNNRVVTLDGIFVKNSKGHYQPSVDEDHYSGPVTVLIWALAWTVSLIVFGGAGYVAYLAGQALLA